ncbi:MAG: hypothetical protein M0R51_13460 [Clostridia bacterium]|jgi:hypothetical protein|nr:hypothetical protein [Clostridia bacterium]
MFEILGGVAIILVGLLILAIAYPWYKFLLSKGQMLGWLEGAKTHKERVAAPNKNKEVTKDGK